MCCLLSMRFYSILSKCHMLLAQNEVLCKLNYMHEPIVKNAVLSQIEFEVCATFSKQALFKIL